MKKWKNTIPKCEERSCSDELLVTAKHIGYNGKPYYRVIKAVYFPYHHVTTEDMGWNLYDEFDWEYCEEDDSYWIPQGWYEVCDYFEDYQYVKINDDITAWMFLPTPYYGEDNEENN